MKKAFAILLFAILLATTISGYAVAQGNVDSRMVDLERQRLEKMFERQSQSKDPNLQEAASKTKGKIEELNRDPEAYFYKKNGANTRNTTGGIVNRNNSNVGQNNSNVGQCSGDCMNEQGICNGQCQGNGQCISRCSEAWGRCVSRCH